MATEDVLAEVERWYLAQCEEDWEHSFGVVIGTLDNPPYDRTETHHT